MAQMNQQNQSQKGSHSWSFKQVAKKDLDNRQWPFKVVRDEGRPTKMEARSITDLNRSFEGTPYNLNDCPTVKGRYTLLFEYFKMRYANFTDKITHLLLTYDSAYFLLKDEREVRHFTFGNNVLQMEDLNGILSNILYKSKYLDNNIKQSFQMYKDSKDVMYENQLKKDIQFYISIRKKIRTLDNNKPMVDILKSELNFTSLQYLVFVPYPQIAKDFRNTVVEGFMRNNIAVNTYPEVMAEVEKLPTLNMEIVGLQEFISSVEKKECHRTLRKVYLLKFGDSLTIETVKKLFLNITNSSFTQGLQYISDAEKSRMDARNQEIQKQTQEEKKALNDTEAIQRQQKKLENIYNEFGKSLKIIYFITDMMTETLTLYKAGEEKNNSEFDAWIKNYRPSKMKTRVGEVYHHRETRPNEGLPLKNILIEVSKSVPQEYITELGLDENLFIELLNTFDELIVPTYFKNDTHTFKSIGCDLTTSEGISKTEAVFEKINHELIILFESTLGNQLATFGTFMGRYGASGVSIAKIIVSNLVGLYKDRRFVLTENVKECANAAYYMIENNKSTLEDYKPADKNSDLNTYSTFVNKYLYELFGNIETKTHSDSESEKEKEFRKLQNLFDVYACVLDIINQCEDLISKEHQIGLLVEKLQTGVGRLYK